MRFALRGPGLAILALFAFAALTAPVLADDQQEKEYASDMNAYFKLSDTSRLMLAVGVTKRQPDDLTRTVIGGYLDITINPILRRYLREADWERGRYFWIRVGGGLLGNYRVPFNEQRIVVEATARGQLPLDFWLVNRVHVDFRDVDGAYSRLYRERPRLERAFSIGGVPLLPYVQAEATYDTRYETWRRRLYQTGVEIGLSDHWRIEPYVARQSDEVSATGNLDRIGLTIKGYW
jgi:hypothetical protein